MAYRELQHSDVSGGGSDSENESTDMSTEEEYGNAGKMPWSFMTS